MGENVFGYGFIDYLVVIGFVIATVYVAMTNPQNIIYILPAAGSLWFFVDFITMITPIKVVPALFILFTLPRRRNYLSLKGDYWAQAMVLLFCVYAIVGLIYTLSFDGFESYSPYKRVVIQFMTYINQLFIYLILKREIKKSTDLSKFFKIFIATTTILCIYGIYQIIAFQYGLPFRGIVYSAEKTGIAYDQFNNFFRLNSLANEPKRLGNILVLGILMILAVREKYSMLKLVLLIILHIVCGFMTYSTTFFLLVGALVPFLYILSFKDILLKGYRRFTLVLLICSIPILLLFRDKFETIYDARVVEQIEKAQNEKSEYLDRFAIDYFQQEWTGFVWGYGMGNYNFILAKETGEGITSYGLDIINSGVLNLLYDFGYLGTALFLYPLISGIFRSQKGDTHLVRKSKKPLYLIILITSLLLTVWHWNFMVLGALNHKIDD